MTASGGGRWWRNQSVGGTVAFTATSILTGGNEARSQVLAARFTMHTAIMYRDMDGRL